MDTSRNNKLLKQLQYQLAFKAVNSSTEVLLSTMAQHKPMIITVHDYNNQGCCIINWIGRGQDIASVEDFNYYN
jgi:hypothetical protein